MLRRTVDVYWALLAFSYISVAFHDFALSQRSVIQSVDGQLPLCVTEMSKTQLMGEAGSFIGGKARNAIIP